MLQLIKNVTYFDSLKTNKTADNADKTFILWISRKYEILPTLTVVSSNPVCWHIKIISSLWGLNRPLLKFCNKTFSWCDVKFTRSLKNNWVALWRNNRLWDVKCYLFQSNLVVGDNLLVSTNWKWSINLKKPWKKLGDFEIVSKKNKIDNNLKFL